MLFSSFTFIFAFLPIVWIVFHLLKKATFKSHYTIAKIFLIVSSLFFYAFWKVAYLPILLSSIIVNYALAKLILKTPKMQIGGGGNRYLDSNKFTFLRFTPKFYFIVGIIFNLCLLGFFKYTDFLLENFNAFSKLAHLDFDIPLPHILLPLALSFVTFQQIAFLFDCYKRTKGELDENLYIDFVDYALFISFFPQLIAGPIVHHREMMPQFASLSNSSLTQPSRELEKSLLDRQQVLSHADFSAQPTNLTQDTRIANDSNSFASCNGIVKSSEKIKIKNPFKSFCYFWLSPKVESPLPLKPNPPRNADSQNLGTKSTTIHYEYLAKGIFIFSIGLFKKVFIADSFAKWANAGFSVVEKGGFLNIVESWATSLSYTFQLYFDFSGYCDMAMGLALMFGIVLPLNFDSPYKSLNIAEFWRRWHITLGRFLRECLYIPLGGNRVSKILNLRNLFIVAFLSGIWHGAGWGFVIWGVLHGVAMVIHRIYSWWLANTRIFNSKNAKYLSDLCGSIFRRFCGFSSARRGNRTNASIDEAKCEESRKSVKKTNALYKFLCWFITFNFINIAWIFFRSENLNGALNLIKGMFGFVWVELPQKLHRMPEVLAQIGGRNDTIFYIIIAFIVCVACKNSFEKLQTFSPKLSYLIFTTLAFSLALVSLISQLLDANKYTPFLYFNF